MWPDPSKQERVYKKKKHSHIMVKTKGSSKLKITPVYHKREKLFNFLTRL